MENVLHAPAQRRGGNRTAPLAAGVVAAFALLAVVAAGLALYGQATVTDFTAKNLAPSLEHPFGTDTVFFACHTGFKTAQTANFTLD